MTATLQLVNRASETAKAHSGHQSPIFIAFQHFSSERGTLVTMGTPFAILTGAGKPCARKRYWTRNRTYI